MRARIGFVCLLLWSGSIAGQTSSAPQPIASGFGQGAYRIGDGVTSPMWLLPPHLDATRAPAGAQGTIEVEAVVGGDGTIADTRLVRTLTTPAGPFDEMAESAVKQQVFAPGMLNGKRVAVIFTTVFTLGTRPGGTQANPTSLLKSAQFAWNPRGSNAAGSEAAKIRHAADPMYTSAAMRAHAQGVVELDVVVQPDGSPGDIQIERPLAASQDLNDAAVARLKEWTFEPARRNGRPIPSRVTVDLVFRLF